MLDAQVSPAEQAAERPKAAAALWSNKQFLFILGAYILSIFGNSFHNIALNLWVLTETGSAKMMTVILVCNLAIASLFGSIAGTFADRVNRRRIMMYSDLLRCVVVFIIALCISLPETPFFVIVLLTGFTTFLGLFESPAMNASLINIVGKEHIQRATGLMNIGDNISRTVGFAVGGIFVAAFGGSWAIAFDGFTFLLSFILVLLAGSFPSPKTAKTAAAKSFKQDLIKGLRFIWTDAFAKSVIILSPTLMLFFTSALMLTQVMAVNVWRADPFQFGLIEACIPLGYMLGAGMIVAFGTKFQKRGKLIMLNLLLMGPAYMILSSSASAASAIPVILIVGVMFSFCTLLINIILRLEVSEELQGRVFGILGSFTSVVPSLGLIAASYFADIYGADSMMLVIGMMLLFFAILVLFGLKKLRKYN
ncbi:MFS transporter [Paenibacillus sp. M1]|uniref:MFS transporter n=1 Tax=Paenibacillus haidiansis TaxID=1574488 RepID=A0ABU7VNQ4_9BACL